jgi:hypothetical protein
MMRASRLDFPARSVTCVPKSIRFAPPSANTPGQAQFRGRSVKIEYLAGLRSGNHILEVGILIDRAVRIDLFLSFTLGAPLLLVLLFLFARLLSAAFFQLVYLHLAWVLVHGLAGASHARFSAGSRKRR